MADSALAGVFTEYELTYRAGTGDWTEDEHGNPVPVTEERSIDVTFRAANTSVVWIDYAEGADPKIVRGSGACISPSLFPAEIVPGAEFTMTYGGREGKLVIDQIGARPLPGLDAILGQSFQGTWRPT